MILKWKTGHISLEESREFYNIEAQISIPDNEPLVLDFQIRNSPIMGEWLIAYQPFLYKSIGSKKFVVANSLVCDINKGKMYTSINKNIDKPFATDAFEQIMRNTIIPEPYLSDITETLGVANASEITLKLILDNWDKIPTSTDVAKWRFVHSSKALITHEIFRYLPLYAGLSGIAQPSSQYIQFQFNQYLKQRREWISSDFKRRIISRKVHLPIQVPSLLKNFNALCLTSTPQSEKAGQVASLSLGTKLDEWGNQLETPNKCMSLTSIQNPFPQRMAPVREIVMNAIDQSMTLQEPEAPLVSYKSEESGLDNLVHTKNLLVARINHRLTHEDGMILSYSAASKMRPFKKSIERTEVPKSFVLKVEQLVATEQFISAEYEMFVRSRPKLPFIKASLLGVNPDTNFEFHTQSRGVVTNIERYELNEDTDMIVLETMKGYELKPGCKFVDRHSNKGTVSMIWPDEAMPVTRIPGTQEFRRVDLMVTPYLAKRSLPSREMEEIASIDAFKNQKPYITTDKDTLTSIRKLGTNKASLTNFAPNYEPFNYKDIPIGIVAYSVLDHMPEEKLKFNNKLSLDENGRILSGKGNFNWTDALFPLLQSNCDAIVGEISQYKNMSSNREILEENLDAMGFKFSHGNIVPNGSLFKDGIPAGTHLITKGRKINEPLDIEETIFDPKYERQPVAIKLPKHIPLFVEEITKSLGSKSRKYKTVFSYLNNNKSKLKEMNIPFENVYHGAKDDKYLIIPRHFIHSYTDAMGATHPNAIMTDINKFVLTANNLLNNYTGLTSYNQTGFDDQIMRLNIMFNKVFDWISSDTVGKGGILRDVLSPRTPYSLYGVASNHGEDSNIIRIPMRALKFMARDEKFRESYGLPEKPTTAQIEELFNKNDIRCMCMRQPCHSRKEVSSYIVRPWHNKSIGLSSAAMNLKSGDFDGDAIFAQFLISKEARDDLQKIKVEYIIPLVDNSKDLKYLDKDEIAKSMKPLELIRDAFNLSVGETENLDDADPKHLVKYNGYGEIRSDYIQHQASAAEEVLYIKQGTASAGGIGNSVRHIFHNAYGREGIGNANTVYKDLAQSALDVKSDSSDTGMLNKLLGQLRDAEDPGSNNILPNIAHFIHDEETRKKLMDVLYKDGVWQGGISKIANETTPFSRLLYRSSITMMYKASQTEENSVATYLAKL